MVQKQETFPTVTRTTRPYRLTIETDQIVVEFRTTSSIPCDAPEISQKVYAGTDYTELLALDVGTLIGAGAAGISLGQLASQLAVGIAVNRGDESAGDWT